MAAERNLSVRADDDYAHRITFTDADGAPMDLTGYEITSQLRYDNAAFDFAVDMSEAPAGIVTISLTDAQTRAITKSARWDLQTVSPSGFRQTWLSGRVTLERDVTR